MNKRFLNKLASLLEDMPNTTKKLVVPVDKFEMDHWYHENDAGCGATACAFGIAALHPYFRDKGLKTTDEVSIKNGKRFYSTDPKFKGATDFQAAEKFFEIDGDASEYLFCPDSYGTRKGPKTVAKRIRSFVQNGLPKRLISALQDNG